jgi:hypothetical protein
MSEILSSSRVDAGKYQLEDEYHRLWYLNLAEKPKRWVLTNEFDSSYSESFKQKKVALNAICEAVDIDREKLASRKKRANVSDEEWMSTFDWSDSNSLWPDP